MPLFTDPRPVVVGHQGAPQRATPNTLPACTAAAAEGARWVELDARRSADGAVVLHHDAWTADGAALVERDADALAGLGVHRLDHVLDGLPPGVGVDVECKNVPGEPDYDPDHGLVPLVAAVVEARLGTRPLCTSSFNPETVAMAADALPQVPAGLIVTATIDVAAAAEVAQEFSAQLLCPHLDCDGLDAGTVAAVRDSGLELLVWTVNKPARARALADAGVDAICTDEPAGILAALRQDR